LEGKILIYSYSDALAHFGVGGAHPGGLALTKKIMAKENISKNMKILDVGCGTGQTSAYLAKTYHAQVYAMDIHPVMLKKAKERFIREKLPILLVKGSSEQIPFKEREFDIIIAESVTAFTDVQKSLKEYRRVLKPNGILITIDMTEEHPLTKVEKEELLQFYHMKELLSEQDWLKSFREAGFKRTEILYKRTVWEELQNQTEQSSEDQEFDYEFHHPLFIAIIQKHYDLNIQYGQKIGYRVFRSLS
jgi:ubiquinone/menaquinone biosynthesis C-methylase UbiE